MSAIMLFGERYFPPPTAGEIYNFKPVHICKNSKARRLLIVYGFVTNHDISKGELHSYKADTNDWGQPMATTAATIDNLIEKSGFSKWDVVAVGYPIHRINELAPAQRAIALAAFDKRLRSWVKQIDPDRILFLGSQPLHKMATPPHVGRIFKYKKIKAVWTICATHLTVADETTSSLLGQAMMHAYTLKRGKNRYTLSDLPHTYEVVDTIDKLKACLAEAKASKRISVDTEGENLNRVVNNLVSVQIAVSAVKAYFIPFTHYESPWLPAELASVRELLCEFFENLTDTVVCGAHLKYECIIFRNILGCRHLPFPMYDVAVGAWASDENAKFYNSVGMSAWSLLKLERDHGYERPADTLAKDQRGSMASQPLSKIAPYGVLDVITPWRIMDCQIERAADIMYTGFERYVIHASEMIHVFASMERRGMPIDTPYLLSLRLSTGPLRKLMREKKAEINSSKAALAANALLLRQRGAPSQTLWGKGDDSKSLIFDIDKTESQHTLFFDVLGLSGYKITKTGKKSIGKVFLKANKAVPEVASYMAYTEAKKVKTGFVDAFAKIMTRNVDAIATKRIRSNYSFLSVLTGRSASSDPCC